MFGRTSIRPVKNGLYDRRFNLSVRAFQAVETYHTCAMICMTGGNDKVLENDTKELASKTVATTYYCYYLSLLYSAILRSREDSLRSHVILHACFEYPLKWCTYIAGMAGATRNFLYLVGLAHPLHCCDTAAAGFTHAPVRQCQI